jgi:hypothetical protein
MILRESAPERRSIMLDKAMRHIHIWLLSIGLVMSYTAAAQQPSGKASLKQGFRDVKLGDTITAIQGLKLLKAEVKAEGELKTYNRPADKLAIGNFALSSISYVFFQGKLADIEITTPGPANSRGLLDVFTEQYGKPYPVTYKDGSTQYWWNNQYVNMIYEEDPQTHNAKLAISDNTLHVKRRIEASKRRREAKQKAAADL